MQATNTTPFSNQQIPYISPEIPYISPVRSFFQNEFTKKIGLLAMGIIGMLAIVFLREYGLVIVVALCTVAFLATNTCLDDTKKVAQPVITVCNAQASSLEMPAYPAPQPPKES